MTEQISVPTPKEVEAHIRRAKDMRQQVLRQLLMQCLGAPLALRRRLLSNSGKGLVSQRVSPQAPVPES